ncbi:hypothetical protein HS7_04200 [Sulfolobales archaeon HS-7]|nr:hypothetical protein HS7_04200 [Sulfolobales archaeon HS-7]
MITQLEVWESGIVTHTLCKGRVKGPCGRVYLDFRPRYLPIAYPLGNASAFKGAVMLVLEGSSIRSSIKVPPNLDIIRKAAIKYKPDTVVFDPFIAGRMTDKTVFKVMREISEQIGANFVFNDSETYLFDEFGSVGFYTSYEIPVIRKVNKKLIAFGIKNEEEEKVDLEPYDNTYANASKFGSMLRKRFHETMDGMVNVLGAGNIISIYIGPKIRQFRDLIFVNHEAMRQLSLALILNGVMAHPAKIFIAPCHTEDDINVLAEKIEKIVPTILELKAGIPKS